MINDELQIVIDEYKKLLKKIKLASFSEKKIKEEKRNWQIQLKESQIEINLLQRELDDVKIQLKRIRKLPSHSSIKSNIF